MVNEKVVREHQRVERLRRRHMLFAQAYTEIRRAIKAMRQDGVPGISTNFSPIHYHMDILPGVNSHLIPAKYVGWRRLRAIDVYPDPHNRGNVVIAFNADYQARKGT
jgi:hypothetical protein